METKNIEQIWKSGQVLIESQALPGLGKVRNLSKKNINRNKIVLLFYLSAYLLMLAVTIVIEIINLSGYRYNSVMVAVHCGVIVLSVAFSFYGINLSRKIIRMERSSDDLITGIRKRIDLYRVHYEIWLWIVASTTLLMTFAINSLVDNDQGHYQINNVILYIILEVGIFLFVYLMLKLVHFPLIKGLRSHLSDLEKQSSEFTDRFEIQKKRWRWWALAGLIVIMAVLAWVAIAGIMKYQ